MLGLQVKNVYLREDSNGNVHVIFKTGSGKLGIASVEDIKLGFPEQLIKDDEKKAEERAKRMEEVEKEKQYKKELKIEMAKHQDEIREAQAKAAAKIHEKASAKIRKKLGL